ncbi:MAG: acetylxylan esterase [Planctomycetota bacterium]|nr:acetylxylan esterase [Planctomycetota bacterium]
MKCGVACVLAGLGLAVLAIAEETKPEMLLPPDVWRTYDPDAGEFNEEVLKRWSEKGADYKEVYFSAYINGQTVRVYGMYAAPTGAKSVPAVMHLHGGGQTVNKQWLEAWTERGYACLSCNCHGVWENRERYTIYPDALKQGNHKFAGGKEMATTPSVRESSWYIWSAVARRALSYVRQQPQVDRERIGAFGVSMGGTTIWSFALDSRLKAVCAIYGCGWNRYYRHTPKYDPPKKIAGMTADDRAWMAGMAPEAYPPYIKCPVLFLSATNDNHGNMDRAYDTLARMPESVEVRQAFTPRFCHHIGADFDQDLVLWMDTWLKGGPSWPKSPVAKVALGADGVPVITVTADKPADVEHVAIYYAVENARVVSRNWRNAAATQAGAGWQASLPVLHADRYLFAFANVRYKSGVHLSSNQEALVPSVLGNAKATDTASTVLYDGTDGTGMWATLSPSTDPDPGHVPVPLRPARGPGEKPGFAVNQHASPLTYQPADPKYRAPAGAALSFDIATTTGEEFTVTLSENYFMPGQTTCLAKVTLKGQPGWQTVTLAPADFKDKAGAAPTGFEHCDMLQLTGPWKDRSIVFTNFRWLAR